MDQSNPRKRLSAGSAIGIGLGAIGLGAIGTVGYAGVRDIAHRYKLGSEQMEQRQMAEDAENYRLKATLASALVTERRSYEAQLDPNVPSKGRK